MYTKTVVLVFYLTSIGLGESRIGFLLTSIGFIALFGIGMLNGVVLVSAINHAREEGLPQSKQSSPGRGGASGLCS